jgi:small subunit ribosomal protein S24e
MQFDPTKKASSSSSNADTPPLKRSFAQQATATAPKHPSPSPSSKVLRVDSPQSASSFSFSRRTTTTPTGPPFVSPAFEMPSSSHAQSPRSSRAPTFGVRSSRSVLGHNSTSRFSGSRGGGRGTARKMLDGPVRDQAYIVGEFNKSPIPLKKIHESTPKSSLGNFSMLAFGKLPQYQYMSGYLADGPRSQQMWR